MHFSWVIFRHYSRSFGICLIDIAWNALGNILYAWNLWLTRYKYRVSSARHLINTYKILLEAQLINRLSDMDLILILFFQDCSRGQSCSVAQPMPAGLWWRILYNTQSKWLRHSTALFQGEWIHHIIITWSYIKCTILLQEHAPWSRRDSALPARQVSSSASLLPSSSSAFVSGSSWPFQRWHCGAERLWASLGQGHGQEIKETSRKQKAVPGMTSNNMNLPHD